MAAETAASKAFQPRPQILLPDGAVKVMAGVEVEAKERWREKEHALVAMLADSLKAQGVHRR